MANKVIMKEVLDDEVVKYAELISNYRNGNIMWEEISRQESMMINLLMRSQGYEMNKKAEWILNIDVM